MEILNPKLRFPEFKGNWERKSLGDIFSIFNGYAFSSSDSIDEGVLWVKIADVGIQKMKKENLSFLPNEYIEKYKKYILKKDDYVIALTRPILNGNLKIAKIDDFFNGSLLNQRVGKLITSNNPTFVFNMLQKDLLIKSIENNISGSDPPNLSPNEISFIETFIPSIEEQTKIANFLSAVDEKLNVLKEKKAALEEYKKGMMQKIFSQEIRFKPSPIEALEIGSDVFPEWEEKSLGEIGDFQTSSIDKLSKENEKKVYLVNYMNVYRHEKINNNTFKSLQVVTAKDSQIESCNLLKGDVLFTPSSETPDDIGHSVVIFEDLQFCVYSYHLIRFRPKVEIDILYSHYFCNNVKVLNQLSKLSTGSTRFTISVKSFSSVKVDLPSIEEQTKIASFLYAIDKKIVIVSQQIEDTQEYKKGLLQQLFC